MLVIAFVFHQGFEGLGLGVVIALSNLQLSRKLLLALIFCSTTPIGISIGIGMQNMYDSESTQNMYARGILNAFASGNLIYIALVEMISEDFHSPGVDGRPKYAAATRLNAMCLSVSAAHNASAPPVPVFARELL